MNIPAGKRSETCMSHCQEMATLKIAKQLYSPPSQGLNTIQNICHGLDRWICEKKFSNKEDFKQYLLGTSNKIGAALK